MRIEQYLETLSTRNEDEISQLKERFLERFDDEQHGIELFRFLFRFIVCGVPLDFLWKLIEEAPHLDKRVAMFDPIEWSLSEPGEIYNWLDWYVEEMDRAVKRDGHSLLFFGYNSNGKTYTALELLCDAVAKNMTGYYITSPDLYSLHNQASYEDSSSSGFYQAIRSSDFLVVDELGKEVGAEDKIRKMLEELLKMRNSYRLPTVLITNLLVSKKDVRSNSTQFVERFGESLWNQLLGRYHLFQFSKSIELRRETRLPWGE